MNLRIKKADNLNWVIEEFVQGGNIATRGRKAGQIMKSRWKVIGYYSSLFHAARGILDDIVADELGQNYASGKQILAAIENANKKIEELVKNATSK